MIVDFFQKTRFFGTLTQSCCKSDEIAIYDMDENKIPLEIKSFWLEENLCFINTTEELEVLGGFSN